MRKGEILFLKWEYIEAEKERCHLHTSKKGFNTVQLSPLALSLLGSIPRLNHNPYVLPGHKAGSHIVNVYKNGWDKIKSEAKLDDFRIHDIRHSYASEIINGGESLSVVQHLLGHTQITTTQRYAHLLDSPQKLAAARAAERIQAKLSGRSRS
jgi:integrase